VNTTGQRAEHAGAKPTIVLVHGAFADASSWNGVIERLHRQGYTVIAPANPLRGVAADKAAGSDIVRSMAQRAGADIVEVEGSHVIMISQPQAVTGHIVKAAQAAVGSGR
jgi:alpha-beta hydrolase superfamily lysophospholipase